MIHDVRYPNRPTPTIRQILNPIWWAGDTERNRSWTPWQWFKRNPFCNFTMTIIGIADQVRCVSYSRSPWTYSNSGLNYGYSTAVWHLPRPFISYRGKSIEWCVGWKMSGGFTCTIRKALSPNAKELP